MRSPYLKKGGDDQESMKREGQQVMVIACRAMAAGSGVSPLSANISQAGQQQPFPTPSPFSFSAPSTSSRPLIHFINLALRFAALVFSFISALSLATPSTDKKGGHGQHSSSFTGFSGLIYYFIVSILVFLYSAFQLFKGVYDIEHRGVLISDMVSDYMSFILDQLVGYLLISSCSVATLTIQNTDKTAPLWNATVISTIISYVTFLLVATSALLSGYKLCKRIFW